MKSKTGFLGMALSLLLGLSIIGGSLSLQGCKTPNAKQQVAVALLVNVAVGRVVEKGTKDPAEWAQRAAKIAFIADKAGELGEDTFADVATVVAALQPIFDKAGLSPSEQLTARTLAATLLQLVHEREQAGDLEGVKATVHLILDNVKAATQIYFTDSGVPDSPTG